MPSGVYIRTKEHNKHSSEARIIHGGSYTRLYHVWQCIKDRCLNRNNKDFHRYGGRNICVCKEWIFDFPEFRDWALANGYKEGLSIDRVDNNGNYYPENCQWIPMNDNVTKAQSIPVNKFDLNGNFIVTYSSINEASRQTGVDAGDICAVCRSKRNRKTAGGYKWEAVE